MNMGDNIALRIEELVYESLAHNGAAPKKIILSNKAWDEFMEFFAWLPDTFAATISKDTKECTLNYWGSSIQVVASKDAVADIFLEN